MLFAPSSTLIAQDDSGQEVFWGAMKVKMKKWTLVKSFDYV